MAIHYDPSSLDSNKTILETLHRIEKYLKDNPIYKVYAINAPYVAGEQYDLTDLVASDSTLAEGDVVFFTNNYYAFVSAVGSEVFSVQNACSFKGETGAQGVQGEQGEQGADGLVALEFAYLLTLGTVGDVGFLSMQVGEGNFNRQTIQYEHFNCYGKDSNNKVYLFDAQVTRAGQHGVPASQTEISLNLATKFLISGENGEDGATGQSALVYGRKINFIWNGETEQLLSGLSLSFQDFNRVPELNEDFVAILHDTLYAVDYLAMGEVQTKSNLNVTSIVAIDINRITGQNGQNGQNGTNGTDGTDGKDALVAKYPHYQSNIPVANDTFGFSQANFNRTAVIGDATTLIINCSSNNLQYMANVIVQSADSSTARVQIVAISQLTGAQGAGAQLYRHYIKITKSTGRQCYIGFDIINQSSTALTLTDVKTFLTSITNNSILNISGVIEQASGSGTFIPAYNLFKNNENTLTIQSLTFAGAIDVYTLSDTNIVLSDIILAL